MFDIGFIDKNYVLTILESMRIKIFRTVKIVTSREIALYALCDLREGGEWCEARLDKFRTITEGWNYQYGYD
jgi:hypothetical protein